MEKMLSQCNSMDFPMTFEEFAKEYGFKDDKEIYTNGSDLISIFRVKQWIEHDNKLRAIETDTAYECGRHEHRWIPVSERLPERDVKVMICSLNGGIDVAYHTIKEWTENQWEWVALRTLGYSKTYRDNKVVAWMPLPEPYGEGECKNE